MKNRDKHREDQPTRYCTQRLAARKSSQMQKDKPKEMANTRTQSTTCNEVGRKMTPRSCATAGKLSRILFRNLGFEGADIGLQDGTPRWSESCGMHDLYVPVSTGIRCPSVAFPRLELIGVSFYHSHLNSFRFHFGLPVRNQGT
jgi:ribosomal protein S14